MALLTISEKITPTYRVLLAAGIQRRALQLTAPRKTEIRPCGEQAVVLVERTV